MNDNKEIKKLSETGEQSAEIVSGGAGNELAEGISIKSPPPNECFLKRERCVGCGKEVFDLMDGKYCGECYFLDKYNHSFVCGTKNNNSLNSLNGNLSGSDLSQVSGGTALDNIEYREFETTCSLCGTKFTARIAKGFAFAGVLRCPSCNAGKSPIIDRSKQLNRLKNFKWLKGNNKVTTQTHEDN